MSDNIRVFLTVMVIALVTAAIRFLPFVLFRKKTPSAVLYLGQVLPYSIMAMLIVYCLKSVSFTDGTHGIPEAVAVAAVVLLHKWKHSTLLSILAGTVLYMVLVQLVF